MIEKTFGLVLQELRKDKGFTQEELAFKSGLDRTYISLLERGLRTPTLNTLFKLSTALEIQPENFVSKIRVANENSK
jgi:transcriptional regulator with XRE-family HTH domain